MTIREISEKPTTIEWPTIYEPGKGWHESVCRSYHVVQKIRELLADGVPTKVVLELIDEMTEKYGRVATQDEMAGRV